MASKRRVRRNGCLRKMAYASRGDAQRALFLMRRRYPCDEWLSLYRCPWCYRWHLGHLPGFVREAILDRSVVQAGDGQPKDKHIRNHEGWMLGQATRP